MVYDEFGIRLSDKVYDEVFPTFEHFSNKPCQYKVRAALTNPNSKFSKASLKLDAIQDTNYQVCFQKGKCETLKGANSTVY